MARITIEESWWTDPRRSKLARHFNNDFAKADGVVMSMWRVAQEFWSEDRRMIPLEIFETLEHHIILIDCKLAIKQALEVYVKGTSQYLDWAYEHRHNRNKSKGGKASAKARVEKYGTAQPIKSDEQSSTYHEQTPNRTRTGIEQEKVCSVQFTNDSNSSGSGSGSGSKEETTTSPYRTTFDFESIYEQYPKKEGKKLGMGRCKSQIKTQQDFDNLKTALINYKQLIAKKKTSPEFVKMFSTFMNCWTDYLDPLLIESLKTKSKGCGDIGGIDRSFSVRQSQSEL